MTNNEMSRMPDTETISFCAGGMAAVRPCTRATREHSASSQPGG